MSFKEGIESAKIKNLIDETEQNVRNFEDVTSKVVEEYTSELDSILNAIKINIVSVEDPATETLEKYLLELTNAAYFVGAKVDTLSMYAAMSKAAYKEAYNDAYLGNQVKDAEKKLKSMTRQELFDALLDISDGDYYAASAEYQTIVNGHIAKTGSKLDYIIQNAG